MEFSQQIDPKLITMEKSLKDLIKFPPKYKLSTHVSLIFPLKSIVMHSFRQNLPFLSKSAGSEILSLSNLHTHKANQDSEVSFFQNVFWHDIILWQLLTPFEFHSFIFSHYLGCVDSQNSDSIRGRGPTGTTV